MDVRYAGRVLGALVSHPLEAAVRVDQRRQLKRFSADLQIDYGADPAWRDILHKALQVDNVGDEGEAFNEIQRSLRETLPGYPVGHDADPVLAEAIWCITRHGGCEAVVETGVARGVSSRFALEALASTGSGHLWSIDLPPLLTGFNTAVGAAVPDRLRPRWTYIRGPSRWRLPRLLKATGPIDLFVQDSVGTPPTVLAELELAWSALRPGGWLIVNAINRSEGYRTFSEHRQPMVRIIVEGRGKGSSPQRAERVNGQIALVQKMT